MMCGWDASGWDLAHISWRTRTRIAGGSLPCVAVAGGMGAIGVFPQEVKELLVDRLAVHADRPPGAQLVIVTGQQMLVMSARS